LRAARVNLMASLQTLFHASSIVWAGGWVLWGWGYKNGQHGIVNPAGTVIVRSGVPHAANVGDSL
jgi:hypothetical protein